jgi:two-component system, NarL family, response regulator
MLASAGSRRAKRAIEPDPAACVDGAASRVMIVDGHPVIRAGMRAVLEGMPEMGAVAAAGTGEDARRLFRTHQPHLTVVDLKLRDVSGVDLITNLRAESPHCLFIAVTPSDGDEDVYRALRAGARGYLRADASADELMGTVRAVMTGQPQLPLDVALRLAQSPSRELSQREMQVLELIVRGRSNREIGATLALSTPTVKARVTSILKKLGVRDRRTAASEAVRRGIVHLQ